MSRSRWHRPSRAARLLVALTTIAVTSVTAITAAVVTSGPASAATAYHYVSLGGGVATGISQNGQYIAVQSSFGAAGGTLVSGSGVAQSTLPGNFEMSPLAPVNNAGTVGGALTGGLSGNDGPGPGAYVPLGGSAISLPTPTDSQDRNGIWVTASAIPNDNGNFTGTGDCAPGTNSNSSMGPVTCSSFDAYYFTSGTSSLTAIQPTGTDANGNADSEAFAINDSNVVVGEASEDGTTQAFSSTAGGTPQVMGPLPAANTELPEPEAISNNNLVVGIGLLTGGGGDDAWSAKTGASSYTDLGALPAPPMVADPEGGTCGGGAISDAYAVNSAGSIVGQSVTPDTASDPQGLQACGVYHAVVWAPGATTPTDLTAAGETDAPSNVLLTDATGIDANGDIVGDSVVGITGGGFSTGTFILEPNAVPTVTSVVVTGSSGPATGPIAGGTPITITGTNFGPQGSSDGVNLVFGPTASPTRIAAGQVVVSNSTTITAVTGNATAVIPTGQPSLVTDVEVTTGGGTSAANPPGDQFTYQNTYTIGGTVTSPPNPTTGAAGKGIGNITVSATLVGGSSTPAASAVTATNGTYLLTVPAGNYTVMPTGLATGATSTPPSSSADVSTSNITGVNFVISGCLPGTPSDVTLTLDKATTGAVTKYTVTATNTTGLPLSCLSVNVTISPIFNSTGRPTDVSQGATIKWGPLPTSQTGTLTWSNLSLGAGDSQDFTYTLTNATPPPVGQVTTPLPWVNWMNPGSAHSLQNAGGELVFTNSPEEVLPSSAGSAVTPHADIEGLLYKEPSALVPGTSPGGEFRVFSAHANSTGEPKDFYLLFYNPGATPVTLARGITEESIHPEVTEPNYMTELQKREAAGSGTGCTGDGTTIAPKGAFAVKEDPNGAVPTAHILSVLDDFCAAGGQLQVGEAIINPADGGAFETKTVNYEFRVAGGTFLTDNAFPLAPTHQRGTYPHDERDVTLPNAATYDVTNASPFYWIIGPHNASDPQYEQPFDPSPGATTEVDLGNYGVLYRIQLALANGTANTPVQVLLAARGGPFAVGVLTNTTGPNALIVGKPSPPRGLLGIGHIPGTQTGPFELSLIVPDEATLPVAVLVAPLYTKSIVSATWGSQPVTTPSANQPTEYVPVDG